MAQLFMQADHTTRLSTSSLSPVLRHNRCAGHVVSQLGLPLMTSHEESPKAMWQIIDVKHVTVAASPCVLIYFHF